MATVDYGSDFSSYPDLDWSTQLTGGDAVVQAVARGLEDAQLGVDLRTWLNRSLSAVELNDLTQRITARCMDDERVAAASVSVTQPDRLSLSLDLSITLADGSTPFTKVLAVTQLGVALLES